MPAVFISYSRKDSAFVRRLHDALSARAYDVWVDWEDIPGGANWEQEIRTGLTAADGFIYVISPDSVCSPECTHELDHAVEHSKRLVPVVWREPDGVPVPPAAAALNWVFLRAQDDFEAGFEQLVAVLETDLEHVRTHTRLGVAAGRWDHEQRNPSQLLRGAELSAAEAWLVGATDKQPAPTQLQREYVLASRQAATRFQRRLITGVTTAAVVAIALAVVALFLRADAIHQSDVAFARQLDAQAESHWSTDPELSLLLARKAAQTVAGPSTQEGLQQALIHSLVRARYTLASRTAGDAVWDPTGTRLLVTSPGAWARIYRPAAGTPPVVLAGASTIRGASGWDAAGDRVILGGRDPGVYDALTGRLIRSLPGGVVAAALTPDGRRAVVVDVQSVGHVYDVTAGRQLASYTPRFHGGLTCFALSPDGRVAAQCDALTTLSPSSPAALDTWDVATGRQLGSRPAPTFVTSVAFSPDSKLYAFGTAPRIQAGATTQQADRTDSAPYTFIYRVGTNRLVKSFPGGAAAAVAFSPNRALTRFAYSLESANVVYVYDFTSGVQRPLVGATDVVHSISFDAAGAYVLAGDQGGQGRVFDATNGGAPVETLSGDSARITSAGFGAGDRLLATASDDGTVRLWAGLYPAPLATATPAQLGIAALASSVYFNRAGDRVVAVYSDGRGVLLDGRTLAPVGRFAARAGGQFAGAVFSYDGRLVTALSASTMKLGAQSLLEGTAVETFDGRDGRPAHIFRPPGAPVANAALSKDGKLLATVDVAGDADLWSARTGAHLFTLPATGRASALAFSPDGARLAIGHDPPIPGRITYADERTLGHVTVDLWNTTTGRRERTLTGGQLTSQIAGEPDFVHLSLAFAPDGQTLALSGATQDVELFHPGSDAGPFKTLPLTGQPFGTYANSLAFSPDGQRLAVGAGSGAYLFRLPTYAQTATLEQTPVGSGGDILDVGLTGVGVYLGFTADSRFLAMLGNFRVTVWDPGDGLKLFDENPANFGSASADGSRVVTAGAQVAIYRCELCASLKGLVELAGRRVTRDFTPGERATYLKRG